MSHLAEQWPYLRYLGLGAWWAWIWLCYTSTGLYAFWPDDALFAPQVGLMYLCSTPAIMCTLLLAAAFWHKVTLLMSHRLLVVAVSCLGVLGSLLIAFAPMAPDVPLFGLGALLTGIGTSILALKTGEVYGTLGGREVLTAGSISLMFTAFLFFMGSGIPLTWQPFFIAALPLVTSVPPEDIESAVEDGRCLKADTIEELLEMIPDMDVEAALVSIERYNELCKNGEDTDYCKASQRLFALENPPFYAAECGTALSLGNLGGFESDGDCHVYNTDRELIPGLYVCGAPQGGRFNVQYPISLKGLSCGMCMVFGKIAGENAAKLA